MANPAKRKGDGAELEAARLLANLTGWPVRRKLGAGRSDDTGDLDGIPQTCLSVKNHITYDRIPQHIHQLEQQRQNLGCPFAGLMLRYRGGIWIVAQSVEQYATQLREAVRPEPVADCPGCNDHYRLHRRGCPNQIAAVVNEELL